MATPRWLGTAANITQVDTITVANTWAAGDTATITIGGGDIVCTAGSSDTTGDVAALISAAINASSSSTDTAAGSYNIGGQEISEFTEVTASVSGSVVSVTANTAGKPFIMSVSESTAGSGTATETTATAATGRNHADNADNWNTGSVPVDGDTIYIDNGSVDILYGIDLDIEPVAVYITAGYTGRIGLPYVNSDNASQTYAEYRDRHMTFGDSAGSDTSRLVIGNGTGTGSPRINIDWNNSLENCIVYSTGTAEAGQEAAVNLLIDAATNCKMFVRSGTVMLGDSYAGNGLVAELHVGLTGGSNTAATVIMAEGSSMTGSEAVTVNSGTLRMRGSYGGGSNPTVNQRGGIIHHETNIASIFNTWTTSAGSSFFYNGSTITTLTISGGGSVTLYETSGVSDYTVTNCVLASGASFSDNSMSATLTNGIDLQECGISDVTIDLGTNYTLTPSAI